MKGDEGGERRPLLLSYNFKIDLAKVTEPRNLPTGHLLPSRDALRLAKRYRRH